MSEEELQSALWGIVRVVAETESTYGRGLDFEDRFLNYYCPFCEGEILTSDYIKGGPFPHESSCIITKAHKLVEKGKQDGRQVTNE